MDVLLAVVSRREVGEDDARPLPADSVRRILEAGRLAGQLQEPAGAPLRRAARPRQSRACRGGGLRPGQRPRLRARRRRRRRRQGAARVRRRPDRPEHDARAHGEGIGSCPNGVAGDLQEVLGLAAEEQVVTLLSFGYPRRPAAAPERRTPDEWIERADRRPFDEVVEFR